MMAGVITIANIPVCPTSGSIYIW